VFGNFTEKDVIGSYHERSINFAHLTADGGAGVRAVRSEALHMAVRFGDSLPSLPLRGVTGRCKQRSARVHLWHYGAEAALARRAEGLRE
jgi:hypothetical protein